MSAMTANNDPAVQTTGTLTISFFAYVSVPDASVMVAASNGLKSLLELGLDHSRTGQLTGARVVGVKDFLPPPGSGYTGWTVLVTVAVDLDRWNAELGPGRTGAVVAAHLLGVLKEIDLSEASGASLDRVECKTLVHGPS
jgi:hypothetical protein